MGGLVGVGDGGQDSGGNGAEEVAAATGDRWWWLTEQEIRAQGEREKEKNYAITKWHFHRITDEHTRVPPRKTWHVCVFSSVMYIRRFYPWAVYQVESN
jgi:hypothetical protein